MEPPEKNIRVMVVDDEAAVRKTIAGLLKEFFPGITLAATAGSVREALAAAGQHKPCLLFLDVELPDGTGFDLLKQIPGDDLRVIFITGHQEYALAAIKVSAVDYIMKPVDPVEFQQAVEKALQVIDHHAEKLKLETLSENLNNGKTLKRIILPTAEDLHVVEVKDIIRAEADSNYTTFRLTGGKRILVSKTIKEYDELLSGSGMIRVHQSHLVNLAYVEKFVKRDGGYLVLKDGSSLPVSQGLRKKVLDEIRQYLYR